MRAPVEDRPGLDGPPPLPRGRALGMAPWVLAALGAGAAIAFLGDRPTLLIGALGALGLLVALLLADTARVAVGCFYLGAFLVNWTDRQVAPAITYSDVLLLAAAGLGVVGYAQHRRGGAIPRWYVLGMAIFLVAGAISTALVGLTRLDVANYVIVLVAVAIFAVAYAIWDPTARQIGWTLVAYAAGSMVNVAVAIAQGADPLLGRYQGFSTHYNGLGLGCALALAGVWYLRTVRFLPLPWLLILAGGNALGVAASGSRASMVAVLALVALAVWQRRTWLFAMLGALILLLTAQLVPVEVSESGPLRVLRPLQRLAGDASSRMSDDDRFPLLLDAIEKTAQAPFTGIGFAHIVDAHNIYLQVSSSAGIIALAGFLLVAGALVAPLLSGRPHPHRWLAAPAVVYLVAGLFSNQIFTRYIWLIVALSLVPLLTRERTPAPSGPPAPRHAASPAPAGGTAPLRRSR